MRPLAGKRIMVRQGAQIQHDSRLTRTLLRQDTNANAALVECRKRGVDWLAHIDDDEVFRPLDPLLWHQNADVAQLHFVNHEACPRWVAGNPFETIRHFKRSGRLPFLLYEGGKSAVRCRGGVGADGPHRFDVSEGTSVLCPGAEILHYGCCSYEAWLRKYLNLGSFSDWYLDEFRTPITKRFHLESRNVVQRCLSNWDFRPCEIFFSQFVWNDGDLQQGRLRGDLLYVPISELAGFVD
ncbi:hypothetical protein [Roseovarius aestuarii]|nr:hypothetical protein [Roseovarius aestuarii]